MLCLSQTAQDAKLFYLEKYLKTTRGREATEKFALKILGLRIESCTDYTFTFSCTFLTQHSNAICQSALLTILSPLTPFLLLSTLYCPTPCEVTSTDDGPSRPIGWVWVWRHHVVLVPLSRWVPNGGAGECLCDTLALERWVPQGSILSSMVPQGICPLHLPKYATAVPSALQHETTGRDYPGIGVLLVC